MSTSSVSTTGATVSVSGLASGIDTNALIEQLVALRSTSLMRMQSKKTALQTKQAAYDTLGTKLSALQAKASVLAKSATYDAKTATVADSSVLSAATDAGAVAGVYGVTIMQRSTASRLTGADDISSTAPLNLSSKLSSAALKTAIVGNGGNTGSFTINGTTISYDITTDTMSDVVARINNSNAGVTAVYDKTGDRFVVTNRNNGDTPVEIEDIGASNFAAAVGLTGAGSFSEDGQNAQIQIDGFSEVVESNDDIFTSEETGIPGLSLTLNKDEGSTAVTVAADTSAVQSAFTDFATAYNDVVKYISDQSKVTGTGSSQQAGAFSGDQSIQGLSRQLRSMLASSVSGQPEGYGSLMSIGFGTTGTSANVSLFNATKLADAVKNNPDALKKLLTDSTAGVMAQFSKYVDTQATGTQGIIKSKDSTTADALDRLDVSIARETTSINAYQVLLTKQYAAMEKAISQYQGGLSQLLSSLGQTTSTSE